MKDSLSDFFVPLAPQTGNGGRPLLPEGVFKYVPPTPKTAMEKTAAAAKLILEDEAATRADKSARLKAARKARDAKAAAGNDA